MRMSRAAAAESRARIVAEAARMLRARGVAGASVAEVMQAAGMTHGGFYKHFDSKDALLAEAAASAFAEAAARFDRRAAREGVEAAAAAYVGRLFVARPYRRIPSGAVRSPPSALRPGVILRRCRRLSPRASRPWLSASSRAGASREQAMRQLMTLLGAVVAARAVGAGALQREILAAARGVCNDEPG